MRSRYFFHCSNILIADQQITDATSSALIGYSDNVTISNFTALNNGCSGLLLDSTEYSHIINSNLSGNLDHGVYLWFSDNNHFEKKLVEDTIRNILSIITSDKNRTSNKQSIYNAFEGIIK